jgi:hypothetical protein
MASPSFHLVKAVLLFFVAVITPCEVICLSDRKLALDVPLLLLKPLLSFFFIQVLSPRNVQSLHLV